MATFIVGQICHRAPNAAVTHWPLPLPADIPGTAWRPLIWGTEKTVMDQAETVINLWGAPAGVEVMVSLAEFESGQQPSGRMRAHDVPSSSVLYIDRLTADAVRNVSAGMQAAALSDDKRQTAASIARRSLVRRWDQLVARIDSKADDALGHIRAVAVAMNDTYSADAPWLKSLSGLRIAMVSPAWAPREADRYFTL